MLEDAYAMMRHAEDQLDLTSLAPVDALRQLTEFTFDHHRSAESFVRLVMTENMHRARHMERSATIAGGNSSAIGLLEGPDLFGPSGQERLRQQVGDAVVRLALREFD